MLQRNTAVTDSINFFQGIDPFSLAEQYGSPLYVYNERIIRERCREMKNLVQYKNFKVNYSAKANSALAFFQIAREEGLDVDAMSPGEIYAQLKAGFQPENIFYVCNNVSDEEMRFAIDRGIQICVDSIAQVTRYGKLNPGGKVAIRLNTGVGAGHHAKVVTGGSETKFGVTAEQIPELRTALAADHLTLCGVHAHIGSLFMDGADYLKGAAALFALAASFDGLEFVDIGGGFGVPYRKQEGERRLDLARLGAALDKLIADFVHGYGRAIVVKTEPGRYISAESGILLGTVHAVKQNGNIKFIGTDLGFNVLARPLIYDAHHEIEVYRAGGGDSDNNKKEAVTIVGNICESGDIIAKNRLLPVIAEGDLLGVLDAGAYGHVMSSNYNNRLRPAQVMIRQSGQPVLIRARDTLEDLVRHDFLLE